MVTLKQIIERYQMPIPKKIMRLYYHKTDGGAEYLMDTFVLCPDGSNEGVFEGATYIIRIDGDITKDAELSVRNE
jgi:hypothetical protein